MQADRDFDVAQRWVPPANGVSSGQHGMIRLPEVVERVGPRKTCIYSLPKAGLFPHSMPLLGRAVGWVDQELRIGSRGAALPGTRQGPGD